MPYHASNSRPQTLNISAVNSSDMDSSPFEATHRITIRLTMVRLATVIGPTRTDDMPNTSDFMAEIPSLVDRTEQL